MQCIIHCRNRTVFLSSFTLFILLLTYILYPWFYIAWLWRKSDINYIDFPVASKQLNNTLINVPAIIHQTWHDTDTIPIDWQQASKSCQSFHPNYEYHLWTDKDARRLIEKEFPCLLSTYDSYSYDIQRADIIRLIALYIYGGIYLDLDIICLKSFDQLRTYKFVLPKTMPVGLSNDFILAAPKHPFLLQVLNDLPKYNRNYLTKYATVMFSTGPMFLTHEASYYRNRFSISVLSEELYGKYTHNSSRSLFRHLKASSWHGNDAAIVKWIYRQRTILFSLSIILFLVIFILIYSIQYYHIIVNLLRKIPSIIKSKLNNQSLKYDKIYSNINLI
ncbi:unnamed protein product [Rotaria sordida]|uniref:Uncharacterized protein n=1 Tax=Rotaria sordida TaxID=392033 RepID=A0A813R7A3_9BILA|nr:unnamed protein product [Rotaria sordida]CAF0799141.1 unnamed protein product [Rotaria sordida]CAF0846764.1 unnamed protein product [Rotaria sordida]CAF0892810.1 unnamed protein product [Rotaria sordida]CAF3975953.1 unnamed protein product [Rotaria sordida]